jgi:hypothetical protein
MTEPIKITPGFIPIFHSNGVNACGEIAFYYRKSAIKRGESLKSSDCIMQNGQHPKQFGLILCGHCHKIIDIVKNNPLNPST